MKLCQAYLTLSALPDISFHSYALASTKYIINLVYRLKSLSLQRCRIDEKKATVLGAALTKNTTLHSLDLEGNPLGPEGVNTIMRSLRKQLQTIARELIPSPRPDSDAEEEEIEGADSYLGEEETVKIRSTEPTYSGRDKKSSGRRRSSSGGQRSRSPSSVHSGHSSTSGSDTRYSSRRSSRSGRKSKRTSRTNMSSARKSVASRMGTPQGGRRKSHTETLAERKAVKKARDELDFEAPLRVLNLAGTEVSDLIFLNVHLCDLITFFRSTDSTTSKSRLHPIPVKRMLLV